MKATILIALATIIAGCNSSPEANMGNTQCCKNKSTCSANANKTDSIGAYDFDENYKGCQTSSCSVSNYNKADIVRMADAKVGDITQCPVSGAIFKVKEESPVFTYDGKTFHTCCSSCANRFKEDPARFTKNVSLNRIKQQHA